MATSPNKGVLGGLPLAGSLKKVLIGELFLRLAETKQTGILSLRQKKRKVEIDWKDGLVLHVIEHGAPADEAFGEMLVLVGALKPKQLQQALLQQKRNMEPLGKLVQRMFGVGLSQVRSVLRVQAIERIQGILLWRSGEYTFEEVEVHTQSYSYQPLDAEILVEEAIPIVDLWPTMARSFSHSKAEIRRRIPKLSEAHRHGLQPFEVDLFQLLEHPRTFRELAVCSGAGKYITAFAVHALEKAKLVEIDRARDPNIRTPLEIMLGGSTRAFAHWFVLTLFLSVGLTFSLWYAPRSPLRPYSPTDVYMIPQSAQTLAVERWRKFRIERALALFRHTRGYYPKALEKLVDEGWLSADALRDSRGYRYDYRRPQRDRYQLAISAP